MPVREAAQEHEVGHDKRQEQKVLAPHVAPSIGREVGSWALTGASQ